MLYISYFVGIFVDTEQILYLLENIACSVQSVQLEMAFS